MAATLLQRLWDQANPGWALVVTSAGTSAYPGQDASEHAVTAVRRWELDLSQHRSRMVDDQVLADVDLVLTMTKRHKEHILTLRPDMVGRVFTMSEYAGTDGDVADPFGGSLAVYEDTATKFAEQLQIVVERIQREGRPPR
jgi:protein-tyrosine-phosphatase